MSETNPSTALPLATKRTLTALIIGGVAAVLDTTIVSIALHTLVSSLHSTVSQIQWVSTGYLLALGVVIPVVGWAQARYGGKRLWMAALTIFVAGSALCSVAWNADSLIAFRVLQGAGAGMLFPLMMTLAMRAARSVPGGGSSLGRVTATVSLPIALGPILGPVLGGVILNWLSWHWLFLINVPICAVGLYLAWRWLPSDHPAPAAARPRFDLAGLLLVAPGMVGVLLGLSNVATDGGFGHRDVLLPLIIGLALVAAFAAWALHRTGTSRTPAARAAGSALVNVRLLRVRSVGVSSAALFLTGACMYGAMFLLPLFYQELRGRDVLDAALLLIPQGVGSLLTRTVAGRLTDRIGARAVGVAGFALTALATVPFAFAGPGTSLWWLGGVQLIRGLGLGIVLIPVMTVAFVDIDSADLPDASMITRISQQVGGSFGVAVAAVVLESVATSSHSLTHGFDQAFWWTVGFTVVAALASLLLPGRRPAAVPDQASAPSGQAPASPPVVSQAPGPR
ncbi:MAG TPA: MDR family MFS transporter [Streptosporangiaceae bacterium]|nr:MDR family MFS transporter [Streptosporangiaceae bacterium]